MFLFALIKYRKKDVSTAINLCCVVQHNTNSNSLFIAMSEPNFCKI